jgi:hypothetical protein
MVTVLPAVVYSWVGNRYPDPTSGGRLWVLVTPAGFDRFRITVPLASVYRRAA